MKGFSEYSLVIKKHAFPAFLTAVYLMGMAVVVTRHDVKPALAATCGNNATEIGEACDGSDVGGENCAMFGGIGGTVTCNESCTAKVYDTCIFPYCGDGSVNNGGEQCDDGNNTNGDGCSSSCSTEAPPETCGNGSVGVGESCDDGNASSGDGCNANCSAVESGFICNGSPSVCTAICGDSQILGSEVCDDGNANSYDGCDATCTSVESGYSCSGTGPGSCTTVCGDGQAIGSEYCDDGNFSNNDGCDSSCSIETGFSCSGTPSSCESICGDGLMIDQEDCDDGNAVDGDGCSSICDIESGFSCTGATYTLSTCSAVCGNGSVDGSETCDDGDTTGGDGCSNVCAIEDGWDCDASEPSVCDVEPASSSSSSSSSSAVSSEASSDPAAIQGAGGGRGSVSQDPPVASGRKANGVKSEEVQMEPILGASSPPVPNRSVQQWYTPALRSLQQSRWNRESNGPDGHLVPLVAAAPMSRREIDEVLAGIHWAACEEESGPAAERKAKRLEALTPDDERRRLMTQLRMEKLSTRGAVMKRIAELLCLPMAGGSTPFKDLDPSSPYAPAIAALTRKELITGYLDESGRPLDRIGAEDTITTAEIAVLLGRLDIPIE